MKKITIERNKWGKRIAVYTQSITDEMVPSREFYKIFVLWFVRITFFIRKEYY